MNAAERQAVVTSIFDAYGEDLEQFAKLVYRLEVNVPGEDWQTYITAAASAYQPFIDSGLSIDWWVASLFDRVNAMV